MRKLAAAFALAILAFGVAATQDDVVKWQDLQKFLPETHAGLAMNGEPEGSTMSTANYQVSSVDGEYGEDEEGHISIMWGSIAVTQFQALQGMANVNIDSSDGYIKALTIQGFPAIEQYDRGDNSAAVTIGLPNKIGIIIELDDCEDTSQCIATGEAMNLSGLSKI